MDKKTDFKCKKSALPQKTGKGISPILSVYEAPYSSNLLLKKTVYDSEVETLKNATIQIFNTRVTERYEQELSNCIVNNFVETSRDRIKKKMIATELSIIEYAFSINPTSEKFVLHLPEAFFYTPEDKVWYINEFKHLPFAIDDTIQEQYSEFYQSYVIEKKALNYNLMPIVDSNIEEWPPEIRKWIQFGTIIKYYQWLQEQDQTISQDSNAITKPVQGWNDKHNYFNGMPLNDVYQFFKTLTTPQNKRKEPFLDEDTLNRFIEMAFCGELCDNKLTFNFCSGEKGRIVFFFYGYFQNCITKVGLDGEKKNYVELLSKYFNGFEFGTTAANFNKPPRTPIK